MKKLSVVFSTTIALLLLVSFSFAQGPQLWKDKELIKQIGLSEKQVNTIRDLSISTMKKMVKIQADIKLKKIDLQEIMDSDKPDEGKAEGLIRQIMKLETDMRIAKTKQMIVIKKTLTPEQMDKLEQFKKEHRMMKRGKRRMTFKKHPMGPGGEPPPERPGRP
ncbi:MAG: hypothetical protein B5M53_07250 [Candidatus Cloacimonas sp. 4484_209]|nr:MAG: hypothetical protein B5M53_07250 [Candidatus Cloacimonas sp. 4484_209]